jgi:hypothetical protein
MNRPGEIEHVVDNPVQPGDFLVDIGDRFLDHRRRSLFVTQRVQRRLDDHQRISHFVSDDRGQTAERGEPLLLRHLPLKTSDRIGQRVERGAEQTCILIVPSVGLTKRNLARQIAGCRHLAHHIGDRRQRSRDGAGNRKAQRESQQHRQNRRRCEPGVNRLERLQLLRARAQNQGDWSRGRCFVAGGRAERPRQGFEIFILESDSRARPPQVIGEHPVKVARQCRGENLAVHPERQVAAGNPLQFLEQGIVEQEADAEGAKYFGAMHVDGDWNGDHLQDAIGLGQQAEAVAAGKRVANGRLVRGNRRRPWRSAGGVEQLARAIGQHQEAGIQLFRVAFREFLDRHWIVGRYGSFERGKVRNQVRHQRERPRPIDAQLIDLRARRHDLPFQRPLGLARHLHVDQVERDADAEDRERGARQEDAAPKRRQRIHRSANSSSAAPPSGTTTALGSDALPSFQAITP